MDKKTKLDSFIVYSVLILNTGDLYLKKMAESSTSGIWVAGDNPKYKFHLIDAERVIQNTQLVAWNYGVCSGLFAGISEETLRIALKVIGYRRLWIFYDLWP